MESLSQNYEDEEMQLDSDNAVAGPSTLPYLPLSPSPFTTPDLHLHSTQDLLARFRIQSSYDAFVKPYVTPLSEQTRGPANLHDVKGKGKETIRVAPDTVDGVDRIGQNVPLAAGSPVADGAPPKEKRRKHDKTYKSLYSDLPGKHHLQKDSYLSNLLNAAPKQHLEIKQFDPQHLSRFVLQPGVVPQELFNRAVFFDDTPDDKKDKKKKKKRKSDEGLPQPGTPISTQPLSASSTPLAMLSTANPPPFANGHTVVTPTKHVSTPVAAAADNRSKVRKEREYDGHAGSPGQGDIDVAGHGRPPKKRKMDNLHHAPPLQQPTPLGYH